MKPFKGLFPIANWLMRIAAVLFVMQAYWKTVTIFDFQSVMFYVAAVYIIFSALLFIGGFLYKSSLTVVSSLILIFVTIYHVLFNSDLVINQDLMVYVLLGSILVYFFTTGNKR